jgi:glycosyltransferase involved in cell wall biosynthesis
MDKLTLSDRCLNVMEIIGNSIVGGMETYVARLLEHLPGDRFKMICVCPFESRFTTRLRELGGEVFITRMADDPAWESIQLLTALTRMQAIDVIHAHLANAHVLAGLVGELTRTPVLATIHARTMSMLDLEAHRLTGTHLSVVCQASYLQALNLGVRSDRLHFIPNGVDGSAFTAEQRSNRLQELLGIPQDTPLIGFVGRLSPEKGPEVFVRAAWIARQSRPDLHFALIGEGPMLERLRTTVSALGQQNFIHFAGIRSDMAEVYASLDLTVVSSYSEGMPLAVMEAMASGLPVVATHAGGVADIVEVGVTGLMRAPADHEGLAQAILILMGQPELRAKMGAAARERVLKNFPLKDGVDKMAALLTALAQAGRTAGDRRMTAVPSVSGLASAKKAAGTQKGLPAGKNLES